MSNNDISLAYSFSDFFSSNASEEKLLPGCHTTDGFYAREILKHSKLGTRPCNHFNNEQLLYLFYGRPAYRVNTISESTGMNSYWPVTFLIDINRVVPKRIFPFDTGAYFGDIYKDFIRPELELETYQMGPANDVILRFINFFYGNNKNYFLGKPLDALASKIPATFFELESYYELVVNKSNGRKDDRGRTIEIQTEHEIQLSEDMILLMVMPGVYLDDANFRNAVTKYAKEIRTYDTFRGHPNEFHGLTRDYVKDYLDKNKMW